MKEEKRKNDNKNLGHHPFNNKNKVVFCLQQKLRSSNYQKLRSSFINIKKIRSSSINNKFRSPSIKKNWVVFSFQKYVGRLSYTQKKLGHLPFT
jgi:hypothetical protein